MTEGVDFLTSLTNARRSRALWKFSDDFVLGGFACTLVFLFLQASHALVVLEPRSCARVDGVGCGGDSELDTDTVREAGAFSEFMVIGVVMG